MGDVLCYKSQTNHTDYYGSVEYDSKRRILQGKVLGLSKQITFQGESVQELQFQFEQAVEAYIDEKKKQKRMPDKPYRGMFTIRISSELHRDIAMYAMERGSNLNAVITEAISDFLKKETKADQQNEINS